ncbi:uncharacterized protein VICG_00916 [Vittaforma corneae ATCC 50505]|uniref:Uncharacterized protein n=1 Tax=Vittaforma corneae (strain ATCC 50505) TaxID=993615 RepID=L2GP20_VITCO|nr:uncharacterized protein VICG_00916 [Vittaforma corneae ATCC 50505]ELA42067.1 hypothetical protein VICG_00916 [Vittaforma corneae ATCC 50505]
MSQKASKTDCREKTRCGHDSCANLELIDEEECKILQRFKETRSLPKFILNLVEEHARAEHVENESDKEACKIILVYLKHCDLDDCVVLRLISLITSRFADSRSEFRDRASFIATALFGKDEFDASSRATFNEFKRFIKPGIVKELPKQQSKYGGYCEVPNNNTTISQNDYAHANTNIFDNRFNPMRLQKAVKILREGSDLKALMSVHSSFGSILERASQRIFQMHSQAIFDQLMDLSHKELYDLQFKSLGMLLNRDTALIDDAIERLKSTGSDVLRTYILYSFNYLYEIASLDTKIHLHLKTSEVILNSDLKLDQISKPVMIAFVEKGIRLLDGVMLDK